MNKKVKYTIITTIIITIIFIILKFLIFRTHTYINGMPGPILTIENRRNSREGIYDGRYS